MLNTITMVMLIMDKYPTTPTLNTIWEELKNGESILILAKGKGYREEYIYDWLEYSCQLGLNKFQNEVFEAYEQLTK